MSVYRHPYKEADFVVRHLLAFDDFCRENALQDINSDFLQQILTEAEKFAGKYLLEQNRQGDQMQNTLHLHLPTLLNYFHLLEY